MKPAATSKKRARGALLKLPEQAVEQCADGESRSNWKFDRDKIVCLVPPGTPIIPCAVCSARVCQIKTGNNLVTLDYAAGYGDETNDFYAPEHNCELL